MKILIAEDDLVSRRLLEATLRRWKYEVLVTEDGGAALAQLLGAEAPRLAILDWMMPELDGPEVCRRVRAHASAMPPYLVLLTAKDAKEDIVGGLDAGADDYMSKPFDKDELRARLRVGERMLALQETLAHKIGELEEALHQVKHLQGLLPICSYCKRIRDDGNYWQAVETYITAHSEARFSHGICPDCLHNIVEPQLARLEPSDEPGA
jgi:sigma-B regulation protein RsbU (phosphoserine phosphatase)